MTDEPERSASTGLRSTGPGSTRSRPRRADAERNIDAIVAAALECFTERPDTSMTAIAHAAGVSRVTLYTHFPTREEVLAAALDLAVADAERALSDADEGPADEALASVIRSSWAVLGRYRNLMVAAEGLSPQQVRDTHRRALDRVALLVDRGRREGVFRTDMAAEWIVTVFYSLVHAAAREVTEGRMTPEQAGTVLERTLRTAVAPPTGAIPRA